MDPEGMQPDRGEYVAALETALAALRRSRESLGSADALRRRRTTIKRIKRAIQLEIDTWQQGTRPPEGNVLTEQRSRWQVAVTQPLMLCSQIQRSGGTLLARLFDGHPMCFAHPSELRWGRPNSWPDVNLSSADDPDALLDAIGESWPAKFAVHGYQKFTKEQSDDAPRYPFIFDEDLQRTIFASALKEGCTSQRDVLNAYLTSLFNAWLDYQNLYRSPKQWVTAFEPRLILKRDGIDRFFADYPDGLLVTIVREPGAWLSSFSRHMPTKAAATAIRLWLESVNKSVNAYQARPTSVVVLLFEELVLNTEAVMRMLCERMAIPFNEVLLEPTYNSMPVLSDSSHQLTTTIDLDVTERYQATLSAEQAAAVARAVPRYREICERFSVVARA
jgi:hypothetical protein